MQKDAEHLTANQNRVLLIVASLAGVSAIICFSSFIWHNVPDLSFGQPSALLQPTAIRYPTLPPEWTPTPHSITSLPAYLVNYQHIERPTADFLLVVAMSFTQSDAQRVVEYYESLYSEMTTLDVIFFCDTQYANAAFLDSTDVDISMQHVLYNYARWPGFLRGSWQPWKNQGYACQ